MVTCPRLGLDHNRPRFLRARSSGLPAKPAHFNLVTPLRWCFTLLLASLPQHSCSLPGALVPHTHVLCRQSQPSPLGSTVTPARSTSALPLQGVFHWQAITSQAIHSTGMSRAWQQEPAQRWCLGPLRGGSQAHPTHASHKKCTALG